MTLSTRIIWQHYALVASAPLSHIDPPDQTNLLEFGGFSFHLRMILGKTTEDMRLFLYPRTGLIPTYQNLFDVRFAIIENVCRSRLLGHSIVRPPKLPELRVPNGFLTNTKHR